MANDKEDRKENESANTRPKTVRQVVVTHLDAPPPAEKKEIHPRRPAPIVPTREEMNAKRQGKVDKEHEGSAGEDDGG